MEINRTLIEKYFEYKVEIENILFGNSDSPTVKRENLAKLKDKYLKYLNAEIINRLDTDGSFITWQKYENNAEKFVKDLYVNNYQWLEEVTFHSVTPTTEGLVSTLYRDPIADKKLTMIEVVLKDSNSNGKLFYYIGLAGVYIVEAHNKNGIATRLNQSIVAHVDIIDNQGAAEVVMWNQHGIAEATGIMYGSNRKEHAAGDWAKFFDLSKDGYPAA